MLKNQPEFPNMPSRPQPELPLGADKPAGPVTCLGKEFADEKARREFFTQLLREKLQDPEFRAIEGFPLGEDEDILALSDPPYYTACPNPWIDAFVQEWESLKPLKPEGWKYKREPFAADVSEGKNHPIYNAHSYHTKVPHRAIMRYILHYTEPGDIVFDGFCGTGMTGVAAQMCADKAEVEALGYWVEPDGTILQPVRDAKGKTTMQPFSKLGARRAVLNDLSPAATFIAYNYNTPVNVEEFKREAERILKEVEAECGWMYETRHRDGQIGKINYTVWSDVFVCPNCAGELVFWDEAVDKEAGKVRDTFLCPHCGAEHTKRSLERAWISKFDDLLKKNIKQTKQVPVLINYTVRGKRHEKSPDQSDLELIRKIEEKPIPYWVPTDRLMEGKETRRNDPIGITHVHHFYTRRNLWVLGAIKNRVSKNGLSNLMFNSQLINISKMNRYRIGVSFPYNPLSGTMYVGSTISEANIFIAYINKIQRIINALLIKPHKRSMIETTSLKCFFSNSIDYIFLDPPFGANLNYSELSFLWESWLKVCTNNKPEAIENKVQGKGLPEYRQLMTECFQEAYRLLKPGRWLTVEFSNTKASVWNNIQKALSDAGFIVANVSALDKQQGSFKAVTTTTAVKQDLVISAYKPNGGFTERFDEEAHTPEGVWDFVRTHLGYLPRVKSKDDVLLHIPERDPRILYDQVVAFYVRQGFFVPLSSQEFQAGLRQRFSERDGMFFLPEQVDEYDRAKLQYGRIEQLSFFVSDEESAINWLRLRLQEAPQTYQEIQPDFMKEAQRSWKKNEKPVVLSELLEQNFLSFNGEEKVPDQIYTWLSKSRKELRELDRDNPTLRNAASDRWYVPDSNKSSDLEKLRLRSLLREFERYKEDNKKLKEFRLESLRAGFKKAFEENDYKTIVSIAERLPSEALEEDPKLLMWYDLAVTRMEN